MPELRRSSLTTAARFASAAGAAGLASLLLLTIHVFLPAEWLQLASIWILGGALLCASIAILTWRMPVVRRRVLFLFAISWAAGAALSIWLAGWAHRSRPLSWQLAIQWIALELSLIVGSLLLRALLRRRTAPAIGRLISLIPPFVVLLVVLLSFVNRNH